MARTLKDKANHFLHHMLPSIVGRKSKHRYTDDDIPADVKPLMETLDRSTAGLRFGNNRKTFAKEKVFARRALRAKDRKLDLDE